MLKKMIIAAALASAAMMAVAGGANAAKGPGASSSAPAMKISKAAPKSFKMAGKRRFRHGRHSHHWDGWYHRPHYGGCYWLKRKARWTGKRYWWKRYYACRYYNHYY